MSLTLQPVRVGNGSDEEGMLVFADDQRLVAVLTHLSDQYDCGFRRDPDRYSDLKPDSIPE
jgi:hypothetical protein